MLDNMYQNNQSINQLIIQTNLYSTIVSSESEVHITKTCSYDAALPK